MSDHSLIYKYKDHSTLNIPKGLSWTGINDEADEEYIDKTPIKFGYIINPNGLKEEDLTLSIQTFIGRK